MNIENNITMKELAEHFRQEQPHLMRYACYRLGDADDAKDALQDVFLKISAKISGEKNVEVRDWRTSRRAYPSIYHQWPQQSG